MRTFMACLKTFVTTTEWCMMICTFVFTLCARATSCMSSTAHVKRGFTPRTVCNVKSIGQGRKLRWLNDSNYLFCTNDQSLGKWLRNIFSQFKRKWPWPRTNWRKSRSSSQEHRELIWRALGSFAGNKQWEEWFSGQTVLVFKVMALSLKLGLIIDKSWPKKYGGLMLETMFIFVHHIQTS